MGVGEDRISELYDPLIHHIFSFLPIKCVVATCILSKRWKDLWISSSVLNIQEWRRRSRSRFIRHAATRQEDIVWFTETLGLVNFLDRVLLPSHPLFRNDLPTMKKFCLDYDSLLDNLNINAWISTLIMRKIEELSLCIPIEFRLPICLFTCETLTMLKIEMAGNLAAKIKKIGTLGSAQTISFPRLKTLHLKHMIFVDESLNAQLFSNSPVLEELMLTNCYMMKKKVLRISSASLKRLFITNSTMYGCKLEIYSPNLQSLTYHGLPEDYVLMDPNHVFSSLVNADINIAFEMLNERTKGRKERQCGLKNLLGGISNVKVLHISGSTLESLSYEHIFTQKKPIFPDLRRLEVSSKLSCMMYISLSRLLLTLPNLESVVIAQGFSQFNNFFGRDGQMRRVCECLLLQLKVIEVWEFGGKQEDLHNLTYFLKNSPVLQTMTISLPSYLPQNLRDKVMKKIRMLPKSSTCCLINFK